MIKIINSSKNPRSPMREPLSAIKERNESFVSPEYEFDEANIMSRRPTRLTLELISRAREKKNEIPA